MNTITLKARSVLDTEDRTAPVPGPGEAVIKTAFCGICRTDRKCFHTGQRDLHMPRVLGHEISGTVLSVGEGVTSCAPGDRVSLHPGIGCGHCSDCLSGNDQRCREMRIFGFHIDGGFSEYVLVPKEGVEQGVIRKLPENVSLIKAAMCEPFGCVIHMADMLSNEEISSLLIPGGGVTGTMTALYWRYLGVKDITLIEPVPMKRDKLKGLGFEAISPENAETVLSEARPSGFDAAIPCCPGNDAFLFCLRHVRNGGTVGFFSGLTGEEAFDAKTLNEIHYRELTVKGSYGCGSRDTLKALELFGNGFGMDGMDIMQITLKDAEDILPMTETEDRVLTVIDFGKEASK